MIIFLMEMIPITGITDDNPMPARCQHCSSVSCCIAYVRPHWSDEVRPVTNWKKDVNDAFADMMDDPSTVWYWLLVYGSATRARARLAHARVGDD